MITIYDIRIRPYDLWACTFSLHVQKREGRAGGRGGRLLTQRRRWLIAGGFNLRPPPPNSVTYVVETYTRLGATFKKLDIIKLEWPIAFPHRLIKTVY